MTSLRPNLLLLLLASLALATGGADAARVANIKNTKHNLSTSGSGTSGVTKSTSEDEICVYCHTPHGATLKDAGNNNVKAPLWNRTIPDGSSYTGYTSSSLDAAAIQTGFDGKPGGSSKLCLSCHDGTLALGQVNVLNGKYDTAQKVPGLTATMPAGSYGASSGFTRNLGTNLTNDHPISVTFTGSGAPAGAAGSGTLADRDGELRDVDANQKFESGGTLYIGVRSSGVKPKLPLEPTDASSTPPNKGQVQCASCHDPHIRETDSSAIDYQKEKFLRLSRFQDIQPTANIQAKDIICRICHNKDRDAVYAYSAHANSAVATQTYVSSGTAPTAADLREFPANLPVWKASCLNCHDPHTVEGSRRLLREGTDNTGTPKQGGNPAIEETCYQCHRSDSTVITPLSKVPFIRDDFALDRRMPIKSVDQPAGSETHDIGDLGGSACNTVTGGVTDSRSNTEGCGKDFLESRARLGYGTGNIDNRHAECTDCHNPHRVMKLRIFYSRQSAGDLSGSGDIAGGVGTVLSPASLVNPDPEGTHLHVDASGYTHTNIISGVLRGAWGVEPGYSSESFHAKPSSYTVKRGDPGSSTGTAVTEKYVTREYQICLKCHSDYGYSDDNKYDPGTTSGRPLLGSFTGGTPSGTNGLTVYTNQAKEFQSPSTHADEPLDKGTDAGTTYNTNNHRSWHPVMAATGRTTAKRGMSDGNPWRAPWSNAVGTQTMYCTDCHGSKVTSDTSVIPDNTAAGGTAPDGKPWGPHGSGNDFILKGVWGASLGGTARDDYSRTDNFLCFKCHDYENYISRSDSGRKTGFYQPSGKGNLHNYHVDRIGKIYCTWCHVAVPHGWKNKAFLVNLNDVGEEAGEAASASKEVSTNSNAANFSKEPYYLKAKLKIRTFQASGNWNEGDCGSAGKAAGNRIAASNGNTTNTTGNGIPWMTNTCSNPP